MGLQEPLTVNALRTNSNLWWPFSYHVKIVDFQNNGINSEKCNEYGRRQCKISKDAWLSWIVYTL